MEAGLISYDMVRTALESLTTGTGRLAGMNDRLAQGTAGQFAKFQTLVQQTAIAFGDALLPEINTLLQYLTGTVEGIDGVTQKTEGWITASKRFFNEIKNNITDLAVAITVFGAALPEQFRLFFTDVSNWLGDLVDYSLQAGKTIAYNLRPDVLLSEVQGKAAFDSMPRLEFTPQLSGGITDQVMAELDVVRRQRIEDAKAAAAAARTAAGAAGDRGAAPPTEGVDMAAFAQTTATAAEQQRVERAGALQTFQRLQDRLQQQDKLAAIAQDQLKAQQQAVTELSSMNTNLDRNLTALGVLA